MSDERISKIIEFLEHFRERPFLYAGENTSAAVGTFLNGFGVACFCLGLPVPTAVRLQATEERGWPSSAEGWSISEMRARGLSEEDIVGEIIAIEIGAWNLLAERDTIGGCSNLSDGVSV